MDRTGYLRLIRGETVGPIAGIARAGLGLASGGYAVGVGLRNLLFDGGLKPVHRSPIPVVSVGNLTLGGTGKTPMVEWIARWFRERDVRVTILSRGYGATTGLNDEGLVLDANLPDVPHLQGPDRAALARIAHGELEAEVVVLDDGFQHRRLARDLDIVLVDALDREGLRHLFPRGLRREPLRALSRADLVVLTRSDQVSAEVRGELRSIAKRAAGSVDWIEAAQPPRDLLDGSGNAEPLDRIREGPVAAFCGIGNPRGFESTLARLGANVVAFRAFADHHPYGRTDVFELIAWAEESGARLVLTTQKDSVKLRIDRLGAIPLRAVRIGFEVVAGGDLLEERLDRILAVIRPGERGA